MAADVPALRHPDAASLHQRAGFEALVAALPGTTLAAQWEALVGKVGGKVFCLRADAGATISFKVTEIGFAGLTQLPGVGQAPYFARRQWVCVAPGAVDAATLRAYVQQAHALIAAKLTRKVRAELGLPL